MRWLFMLIFLIPSYALGEGPVLSTGQLLYVPVYSHIYIGNKERPFNLAVTLSVRNTDPREGFELVSVDYYDTDGKLLKHYLDVPRALPPLSSQRFVVAEGDVRGGSGANFIVRWQASVPVNAPVVESIMIGTQSGQGISFTSSAREIQ